MTSYTFFKITHKAKASHTKLGSSWFSITLNIDGLKLFLSTHGESIILCQIAIIEKPEIIKEDINDKYSYSIRV